jgi:hypothetical protein
MPIRTGRTRLDSSTNAANKRRRLLAGTFASRFSARFATWMVQVMDDFLETPGVALTYPGAPFLGASNSALAGV